MHPGITTSLERLIELRLRAASYVDATTTRRSKAQLLGRFSSKLRGRGLDYAESRHYQPGDELRSIDWRVTARTQTTHTKLFTEEKERPMLIALDQRVAMGFGSRIRFKSVQAAELASLLIWASHRAGDRIGGLLWNDQRQVQHKPQSNQSAVLFLLREIAKMNQELGQPSALAASFRHEDNIDTSKDEKIASQANPSTLSLSRVLRQLRRVAKPGTHINIISDFDGFDEHCVKELSEMRKHCDISAYKIYDDLEVRLPSAPALRFFSEDKFSEINTTNKKVSGEYAKRYESKLNNLLAQLRSLSIPLTTLSTQENISSHRSQDYLPEPVARSDAKTLT